MANRILVFKKERLIEDGTQVTLIKLQGEYSLLYALQASIKHNKNLLEEEYISQTVQN
jgi:hypothetical protein